MESLKKFLFTRLACFIFGIALVDVFDWARTGEIDLRRLLGKAFLLLAWTIWVYFALTRVKWLYVDKVK